MHVSMPLKDGEETVRRVETMSTVARADETAPHVLLAEEDATDETPSERWAGCTITRLGNMEPR